MRIITSPTLKTTKHPRTQRIPSLMTHTAQPLPPEEDLRILREMLVPGMITEPDTGTDGKPRLRLTDPDNPKATVTITDLLPHTIAVKSDAVPCTSRCFQTVLSKQPGRSKTGRLHPHLCRRKRTMGRLHRTERIHETHLPSQPRRSAGRIPVLF